MSYRTLIFRAAAFAAKAHGDQKRKYTGDPYIVHPLSVAEIVSVVYPYPSSEAPIIAALLHDVVEDTDVTLDEIRLSFGDHVATLVDNLTKRKTAGARSLRMKAECERLARCCPMTQTIKVADLIDNTSSIVNHDPAFARIYLAEKEELLNALTKADRRLLDWARAILSEGWIKLLKLEKAGG